MINYKVEQPDIYLLEKYGRDVLFVEGKYLKKYLVKPMSDFNAKKHCSITSVYKVFEYLKSVGFGKIDISGDELFYKILDKAKRKLYYTEIFGTQPFFIDNLTNSMYKEFNYPKLAKNILFFSNKMYFENFIKQRIEKGTPLIMSLFLGPYSRHTISIIGYRIYQNRGAKIFLAEVDDNWSKKSKFIDLKNFFTIKGPIFEICDPLYKIK